MENVNRISIIGGSGTGKTSLATVLGKELKLPVTHIDGINYFSNWVERPKEERDEIICNLIKNEKWIIDGTYRGTLAQRLELADLIIYLDYSTWSQIKGIVKRRIKTGKKEKREIKGCKEQLTFSFFSFVLHWRKNKRAEIMEIVTEYKNKGKNIIIFKKRKDLNKWFKQQFSKNLKDEIKNI
jgi:adenylate kinase family enzyme